MKPHISDLLSNKTFAITGGLAVFVMTAVFIIAGRDQLLGVDRWCYEYGHDDTCVGACPITCRDDESSCELSRKATCRTHGAEWVSDCAPREDGIASAHVSCVDAAP
jgi:hypothetical protein